MKTAILIITLLSVLKGANGQILTEESLWNNKLIFSCNNVSQWCDSAPVTHPLIKGDLRKIQLEKFNSYLNPQSALKRVLNSKPVETSVQESIDLKSKELNFYLKIEKGLHDGKEIPFIESRTFYFSKYILCSFTKGNKGKNKKYCFLFELGNWNPDCNTHKTRF